MLGYKITTIIKNSAGVSVKAEAIGGDCAEAADKARVFLISEECFAGFAFAEGDEITEEEACALEAEAQFCRAAARAIKILSYSSHSKSALVRKLCGYGFDKETAVRAADDAEEKGELDESRQAEHLTDYYLRHKYWGKKRIAAELISRGYTKVAILSAISGVDESRFSENLARLISKKPVPDTKPERDRYISSLSRMGYSLPEILNAIKEQSL